MKKTQTQKTTDKITCFAHQHMNCREYGLWTHIRELQSKAGSIYFDGDWMADSFDRTKRGTIYADCKRLVLGGWVKVLDQDEGYSKRKSDGTFKGRHMVALSHREWASENPGKCEELKDRQFTQKNWASSPTETDQFTHVNQPVHGCEHKHDYYNVSNNNMNKNHNVIEATAKSADGGTTKNDARGDRPEDVPTEAPQRDAITVTQPVPDADAMHCAPRPTPAPSPKTSSEVNWQRRFDNAITEPSNQVRDQLFLLAALCKNAPTQAQSDQARIAYVAAKPKGMIIKPKDEIYLERT